MKNLMSYLDEYMSDDFTFECNKKNKKQDRFDDDCCDGYSHNKSKHNNKCVGKKCKKR
jgi:hypothetical protein